MSNAQRLFHLASSRRARLLSTIAAVVLLLYAPIRAQLTPTTIRGIVAGSQFTAPTISNSPSLSAASLTVASHFKGAKVCVDANNNGSCEPDEPSTMTDATGGFLLRSFTSGPIAVEIGTSSLNAGQAVTERMVFRAPLEQIAEGAGSGGTAVAISNLVVSPLSTEVLRMMDADGLPYQTAKQNLAARLGVATTEVLSDPGKILVPTVQKALLTEDVILTGRFALAARMVDRGDTMSVTTSALSVESSSTPMTMKQAHQAVMSLESIPRYDHIFAIMLENKGANTIVGSQFAPAINAYLAANNQFISYFETGNPSEPNRLAEGSADDFGITDDSAYNCIPADTSEVNAPEDLPIPNGACTNATNHNIKGQRNLFNALSAKGMTWRMYNETQLPGRDWRQDTPSSTTIVAPDKIYPLGSPVGAIGTPGLMVRLPSGAYAIKHNSSVFFQNVRSAPEFVSSNRTMGGGQWDQALLAAPTTPAGWDIDQLGTDLWSGDVGNLNFLEPDQCDDMHGLTVQGTIPPSTTLRNASDCSGNALIYRGDQYTDYLVKKIQASPIWTNPQKRVAIIIFFDEGTGTAGLNSCCGWNPVGKTNGPSGNPVGPLVKEGGVVSNDASIANYFRGNKGHGTSIFAVISNQPSAPRGVIDSDSYSHISFVRTMQDMFGLADPGDDWSYMNRSKYTERFILANLLNLPEYIDSADTHFDGVRPMNHAYRIPDGYAQKSFLMSPANAAGTQQIGPDADQRNPWALK